MPTTIEALVIVALVLTPGYLFTQLARRVIAHIPESSDGRFFLTIITTGTIIHGLIFVWASRILNYYLDKSLRAHRWETFFWAVTTILLLPIFLGIAVGKLSAVKWVDRLLGWISIGYMDRMPSAWDFIMRQRRPAYVRVHLKDGKGIVAGVYANESMASLVPNRTDIYLEEGWQLDEEGTFIRPIVDSQGVWISHDVIGYVEFLNREGETNGQQQPEAAGDQDDREPRHGEEGSPADRDGQPATAAADAAPAEAGEVGREAPAS